MISTSTVSPTSSNPLPGAIIDTWQADGSGTYPIQEVGQDKYDLRGKITADEQGRTYLMHVPGVVSTGLNDREIAAVMNYVVDRWGNARQPFTRFTPEEVTHLRAIEVADVVAYRRDLIKRLQAEGQPVAAYPWP